MENSGSTLSIGNYIVHEAPGGFGIFLKDELDVEEWIATAPDPEVAMRIVEGLVLVEMKRFHYPESEPVFKNADDAPFPPFLKKGS